MSFFFQDPPVKPTAGENVFIHNCAAQEPASLRGLCHAIFSDSVAHKLVLKLIETTKYWFLSQGKRKTRKL